MIRPEDEVAAFDPAQMARAGLLLLAFGVWLVPRVGRLFRRCWGTRSAPRDGLERGFGPLDSLALVAAFIAFQTLATAWLRSRYADLGAIPVLVALATNASYLSAVAAFAVAWARRRTGGVAALGLRAGDNARAALLGAASWILCVPLLWGLALAWPWLLGALGGRFEPQAWGTQLAGVVETAARARAVLLAALVVPLLEELVFRGALQPMLVRGLGLAGGMTLTAGLFATLHGVGPFLPILALALLLSWLRERTGRLAPCIAVHVLHNGVQMALLFLFGAEL